MTSSKASFSASRQWRGRDLNPTPSPTIALVSLSPRDNVTFPQDVSKCVPSVSIGNTSGNTLPAGFAAARADGPINTNDLDLVDVVTRNAAGTGTNLPFNLSMSCPVP
jgi:hypothetical protein